MPLTWRKAPKASDEARRSERLDIFLQVAVEGHAEPQFGLLLDLSGKGAKIGAVSVPPVGTPLVIRWEGDALSGRCAWATSCRYGVAFDRPVESRRLAAMLAR
jgi:hypothetical protein